MEENPLREDRILEIACLAGRILLENGAEVYRVEETVNRICGAYALAECQCFATPTALIVSAYDEEGKPHTLMRRVAVRDVDLAKINRVNGVSRRMGEGALPLAEAKDALLAVEDTPHFPRWLELIAAGTGIGCFALLFGGGLPEALCAALGAALLQLFMVALRPVALPNILRRFLGGFLATVLSRLALLFFPAASWQVVNIAVIMLLVPGLMLTNAFRDMAAGDLISGVTRTFEALAVAAALAGGAALAIGLFATLGVNG